jgi:hypothetical protein
MKATPHFILLSHAVIELKECQRNEIKNCPTLHFNIFTIAIAVITLARSNVYKKKRK